MMVYSKGALGAANYRPWRPSAASFETCLFPERQETDPPRLPLSAREETPCAFAFGIDLLPYAVGVLIGQALRALKFFRLTQGGRIGAEIGRKVPFDLISDSPFGIHQVFA